MFIKYKISICLSGSGNCFMYPSFEGSRVSGSFQMAIDGGSPY